AAGEALDLIHGTSVAGDQKIYAGNYEKCSDSDMVVITAGLRRKPDESRLDLINRNVSLFKQILDSLKTAGLKKDAIVFVVSNPVDVLTRLAIDYLKWDPARTIGLGTQLDTARFRSLIALETGLPPSQIKALILGEHGDSMVPIWSSATVNGTHISGLPGYDQATADGIFEFTKKSGAEVIRLKGGAGWAVGVSIKEVVEAIALNSEKMLPVSSMQNGALGISGICLSLPTIVGRNGVHSVIAPAVSDIERELLLKSQSSLKEAWDKVA
nr:lactate/malate dehydrogenase family protein [Armatimonadota bacterium]